MNQKKPRLVDVRVNHGDSARKIQIRNWSVQPNFCPCAVLNDTTTIAHSSEFKTKTNAHHKKDIEEIRQGALFAYLLGMLIDNDVDYAPFEASDHDCVLRTEIDGEGFFLPVQLKEVPSLKARKDIDVIPEIHRILRRCGNLTGTTVAICINRRISTDAFRIDLSQYQAEGVWVFGMLETREAILYGNLRANRRFFLRVKTEVVPATSDEVIIEGL